MARLVRVRPEGDELSKCGRDTAAEGLDARGREAPAAGPVGFAVGDDRALVADATGGLDLDVLVGVEERGQPLPVGEEVGAGVQGPAGGVERVAGAAAVAAGLLLDPAPPPVHRVAREAHDVEVVHGGHGVGQFLVVAVWKPVMSSIATSIASRAGRSLGGRADDQVQVVGEAGDHVDRVVEQPLGLDAVPEPDDRGGGAFDVHALS